LTLSYTTLYVELIERHLGRKPELSEGSSEADIGRAEAVLGLQLPASVRDYFRVAGNLAELNKAHNRLYDLSDLIVEEGFLLLLEENQAVVHWGIKTGDLSDADPVVWQRVNSPSLQWYPEGMKFSEFMVRMFDWQAGFE
jgi:cell wall assembly regulator SMI1